MFIFKQENIIKRDIAWQFVMDPKLHFILNKKESLITIFDVLTFLVRICAGVESDDPNADKSCLILYDPWDLDNFLHYRSCIPLIKLNYGMLIALDSKFKNTTVPFKGQ